MADPDQPRIIRFGSFEVDKRTGELRKNGSRPQALARLKESRTVPSRRARYIQKNTKDAHLCAFDSRKGGSFFVRRRIPHAPLAGGLIRTRI
jgi:hypothetical protein